MTSELFFRYDKSMSNKYIFIIIAVLVISGLAYFWQNQAIVSDTTTITTSQPTSTANDQLVAQKDASELA